MRRIASFPILLVLSVCFVWAQETPKGTNDDIARRVEKEIRDENKVNIENLTVLHDNGTIYLGGTTQLFGSRYKAEEEAREVKGVTNVKNEIVVTGQRSSDLEIEAEAIRRIRRHLRGSPFDLISLEVRNGFVTMTGNVRDQSLVRDGLESVIWIPGVRGVDNQIEYASIAAGDERLRQAIFRRIQREFPQYFVGADPSVLILVNSGRVRLVGYVDTNPTIQKIGSTVRSMPGVLSVDNQLQTK